MLKIYFSTNDELTEKESILRECRLDVLVELDGKYYQPNFITLAGLTQEVNYGFENDKMYLNDVCQLIVRSVDKNSIIEAVEYHCKYNFFNSIKDIDLQEYFKDTVENLWNIHNWILVYSSATTSNR